MSKLGAQRKRANDEELVALRAEVESLRGERDTARAEVEMLRGVGCCEAKEGEPESGPCGVCLKCARRERDEARAALAAARAPSPAVRPLPPDHPELDPHGFGPNGYGPSLTALKKAEPANHLASFLDDGDMSLLP